MQAPGLLCFNYRSNEAIAPSSHSLNKAWIFRIVVKNLPYLANSAVDAIVRVQKGAFAPDPFGDLLPSDKVPSLFDQQDKDFERSGLQLHHLSSPTKLTSPQIELEVLAELEHGLDSDRFSSQMKTAPNATVHNSNPIPGGGMPLFFSGLEAYMKS